MNPVQEKKTGMSTSLWLLLWSVCFLIFLINIDYTAVNLALLPISKDVPTDLNMLQWLMSGYVLVWGALVVPAGRLTDLWGKKHMIVGGTLIFLIGSWLTGVGNSIELLIFGRVLQGIGAAFFAPGCYGVVFAYVPKEKQGFALGFLTGVGGLGLAAGPTLAGIILEYLDWRWIFYMNIPIGVAVIASLLAFLPKEEKGAGEPLNYVGTVLLATSLGVIIVALNQIEIWGAQNPKLWGIGGLGLLILAGFVMYNKQCKNPLLPSTLLQNKQLSTILKIVFLHAFNFSLLLVIPGIFVQKILGYSSYEAGLVFLSMTIVIGIMPLFAGYLTDKMDVRYPAAVGTAITLGSAAIMAFFFTPTTPLPLLITALALAGLGLGTAFPAINTMMMRSVEAHEINTASGMFMMFMMLGNTVSVVLGTSLIVIIGRFSLEALARESGIVLTPELASQLLTGLSDVGTDQVWPDGVRTVFDNLFMVGLSLNMMVGMLCAGLIILLVATKIKKLIPPKEGDGPHITMM